MVDLESFGFTLTMLMVHLWKISWSEGCVFTFYCVPSGLDRVTSPSGKLLGTEGHGTLPFATILETDLFCFGKVLDLGSVGSSCLLQAACC